MPLLQINAGPDGPRLHGAAQALLPTLRTALRVPGPIIVMIHGYKFAPGHAQSCPHQLILSLRPRRATWKVKSWPRALGFGVGNCKEGLAIAFGWSARGTIWQAYQQAEMAGLCLSDLIAMIQQIAPHKPVHMVAHSLGARVALGALPHVKPGSVGRSILLNGAEFGACARMAVDSPAGRLAEVINVTTRENDVFDFLLERLIRAPETGDRSLAQTLPVRANTLTVQLDHPGTIAMLSDLGFSIAPGRARVCHWSTYLRDGLFEFYSSLLRCPDGHSIAALRAKLPDAPDPRWSRVLSLPDLRLPSFAAWTTPGSQTSPSSRGMTSNTINQ
ncbi:MAG: alpha/beta hydrolase [Pseudomonadota bacterium]